MLEKSRNKVEKSSKKKKRKKPKEPTPIQRPDLSELRKKLPPFIARKQPAPVVETGDGVS